MILPPPKSERPAPRKHLSLDAMISLLRRRGELLPDARSRESTISISDAFMSAFAMFSLKDPSLLAFEARCNDGNMKTLYGIGNVPSDTQMREILDPIKPDQLRPFFNDVLRQLQRGKALEPFVFHKGCYLISLDGTGYFSSNKVHCESCLCKKNKKTGELTYHHQMLGAALVHPNHKEVIPLAPEPIIKQDGDNKNDCERNASKRLLRKIRQEHPHLKLIVVEDSLASNAPHIRELIDLNMHFLLGVKPGDHAYLFDQVLQAFDEDRITTFSWHKEGEKGVLCEIVFLHDVPLNESNQDVRVNFLQFIEYDADGHPRRQFSWVTDLKITKGNAQQLVRGGRARWKIENETFNTLKNQGYHFEHNFGHGKQNLSVVFAMLMMVAFLVDQTQQLCCPLFQAVLKKAGSKRELWDRIRSHFRHFQFQSMQHLYEVELYDLAKELPAPRLSIERGNARRTCPRPRSRPPSSRAAV
jgi:hypothetical protein